MTDNLTRWAIGLGVGALAGATMMVGHLMLTSDIQAQSARSATSRLAIEHSQLDATIEFDSYDREKYADYAQLISAAGLDQEIWCGGYENRAHGCTIDAVIPNAFFLTSGTTQLLSGNYTLTTGKYRTEYLDILKQAATITVQTDAGPQNATYQGGGEFTLTLVDKAAASAEAESWRTQLARVPNGAVWVAAGGVATVVAVLFAGLFRPREEEVELVEPAEFFASL